MLQVLHDIFSATTKSKLVLFILLAWISLQRESKRERERDNSVNNPPLLAYITGSFANGSVRFMRGSYKAHLAHDVTVSLKLIRFNHHQSLLAPTERWIRLANWVPVTVRFSVVRVLTCVQTWSSCHSLAGCCRSCWDYSSSTESGSLHNSALWSRILLHPPRLQHHQSTKMCESNTCQFDWFIRSDSTKSL